MTGILSSSCDRNTQADDSSQLSQNDATEGPARRCWICTVEVKPGEREGTTALHYLEGGDTLCEGGGTDGIPFRLQRETCAA